MEHRSQDRLFQTKHLRFVRARQERQEVQHFLHTTFATHLTGRTERRYRRPSSSQPHLDTLIQMVLSSTTRYGDALRAGQLLPSDRGRFSLQTLLAARTLKDIAGSLRQSQPPQPVERWRALRDQYAEWSAPLSMRYPSPRLVQDQILHLPQGAEVRDLSPPLNPGSVLFLDKHSVISDRSVKVTQPESGWQRQLYALQRGGEILCGYLRRDGVRFHLSGGVSERASTILSESDMERLYRVGGVVVPV